MPEAVRSLGFRSELMLFGWKGTVERLEGGCIRCELPQLPDYSWANMLIFDRPPRSGDAARWIRRFREELPERDHLSFGWDAPDGAWGRIGPFEDRGFERVDCVVHVAEGPLRPGRPAAPGLSVRPLGSTDEELTAAVDNQISGEATPVPGLREFALRRMRWYHQLIEDGRGCWFGGFLDGRLVGDLGIFAGGDGLARFQSVTTHPDYRRRGICSALMSRAVSWSLERGARQVVVVANEGTAASRLYQRLGMPIRERQVGVLKRPLEEDERG